MDQQPLVSVLMTAYNRELYIAEAIESVLASTYTNFELIIVDDGSKDKTVEIALNYKSKDDRVKVYINEKNLGDYPNRNKAASYANGKYLKYVDADDFIYPRGLEILVNCMEQFPDAGWGICSLDQIKEKPFPLELNPKETYQFNYFRSGIFKRAPLSSIIKKKVFDQVSGFNNIRMAGDYEMWHRLAQKFPVVLMPHGIVWYRQHDEQEMKDYKKYLLVYDEVKFKFLKDHNCPLDKSTAEKLIAEFRLQIMKQFIVSMAKLDFNEIRRNISRLKVCNK